MSDSGQPHGLKLASPLCPWDSPGKNAQVNCHFFLQGIIPTQRLNCDSCMEGGFFTPEILGKPMPRSFGLPKPLFINRHKCLNVKFQGELEKMPGKTMNSPDGPPTVN